MKSHAKPAGENAPEASEEVGAEPAEAEELTFDNSVVQALMNEEASGMSDASAAEVDGVLQRLLAASPAAISEGGSVMDMAISSGTSALFDAGWTNTSRTALASESAIDKGWQALDAVRAADPAAEASAKFAGAENALGQLQTDLDRVGTTVSGQMALDTYQGAPVGGPPAAYPGKVSGLAGDAAAVGSAIRRAERVKALGDAAESPKDAEVQAAADGISAELAAAGGAEFAYANAAFQTSKAAPSVRAKVGGSTGLPAGPPQEAPTEESSGGSWWDSLWSGVWGDDPVETASASATSVTAVDGQITKVGYEREAGERVGAEGNSVTDTSKQKLAYEEGKVSGALGTTRVNESTADGISSKETQQRDLGASYDAKGGLAVNASAKNTSEEKVGDQVVTDAGGVTASYAKGVSSVGLSSERSVKEGDKVQESRKVGLDLSANQDFSSYSAGFSGAETKVDEDGNSRTLGASLGYDAKKGVSGEASRKTETKIGDNSWSSNQSLTYKDGRIGASLGEGSHLTDSVVYGPNGEALKTTEDRSRSVSGSWGEGDGLALSVAGGNASQSQILGADGKVEHQVTHKNDAQASYAKGVASAGLSESKEVVDGKATTAQNRGISGGYGVNEKGETVTKVAVSAGNTFKDENSSRSTAGNLSYDSGVVVGDLKRSTMKKDGTDTVTTDHGLQVGYDEKKGHTAYTSRTETTKTDVGSSSTSAGFGFKEGSFAADVKKENVLSIDDDHSIKNTSSLGYSGGQATASKGTSSSYVDEGGNKIENQSNATLGFGEKGLTAGYSAGNSVTNADKSKTATSWSGGANLSNGEISAGYGTTKTDAEGKVTSGLSANGAADFGQNGLEGLSGAATMTKGAVNVSVFGSYKVTTKEPVQQKDGSWLVTWSRVAAGGLGGGASKGAGGLEGSKASVNVGVSGSSTEAGSKVFASQADAKAWFESPRFPDLPATADAALEMSEGETISETDALGASVGASGSVGMLTVGAGVQVGSTETKEIEKGQGNIVFVTVKGTDMLGGNASLGAGGISMGAHASHTDMSAVKVKFDLGNAADKAAYDAYLATGQVPASKLADVMSRSKGYADTVGTDIGAFGAKLTMDKTVGETTTEAGGHKVESALGSDSVGLTVPLLGHYARESALQATEVDDAQRLFTATTKIDATDALDASKALADATGTHSNALVEGKSTGSGKWSATESFTDAQVQGFVKMIQSDAFDPRKGTMAIDIGFAEEMAAEVKAAGNDQDKIRLALAKYVSEGGSGAFEQMRACAGAPDKHVALEGDKYFTGLPGYLQTERRIGVLESKAANPGAEYAALSAEGRALKVELNEKLGAVTDYSKYKELPPELRVTEQKRTEEQIARVEAVLNQLVANKPMAEGQFGPPVPPDVAAANNPDAAILAKHEANLVAVKGRCSKGEEAVRKSRWVHDGAHASVVGARQSMGFDGLVFSGEEQEGYAEADAAFEAAYAARTKAIAAEGKYDLLDPSAPDLNPHIDAIHAAFEAWSHADVLFQQAEAKYQSIRERHSDKPGLWVGYEHALPPGMGV